MMSWEHLKDGITAGMDILKPGGRLAIISFHSGEDRIVKRRFRELEKEGRGEIETKKPIAPSSQELHANPKARSAKLRIITKKHEQ
jgi:16S rRNA (cytosine1402-N4)-methyltransferase